MQRSVARPTSSASTSVRPRRAGRGGTGCGPSPSATPAQIECRVHALARRGPRRSWSIGLVIPASSSAPRWRPGCSATAIRRPPAVPSRRPTRRGPRADAARALPGRTNGEQHYDEGISSAIAVRPIHQPPLFRSATGCRMRLRFGDVRLRFGGGGVTASTRVTNTAAARDRLSPTPTCPSRSTGQPPRQLKGYEKVASAGPERRRLLPARPRRPVVLRRGRAPTGRRRRPLHAVGGQLVARPARERELRARHHGHR